MKEVKYLKYELCNGYNYEGERINFPMVVIDMLDLVNKFPGYTYSIVEEDFTEKIKLEDSFDDKFIKENFNYIRGWIDNDGYFTYDIDGIYVGMNYYKYHEYSNTKIKNPSYDNKLIEYYTMAHIIKLYFKRDSINITITLHYDKYNNDMYIYNMEANYYIGIYNRFGFEHKTYNDIYTDSNLLKNLDIGYNNLIKLTSFYDNIFV